MPVSFDSDRVISFNTVNGRRWNRNLDGQLTSSTAHGVRTANLVMSSRFHEINEPGRNFSFTWLFRWRPCRSVLLLDAERKHVFESRGFATICSKCGQQLLFSAEPIKRCVVWEGRVASCLAPNLALKREPSQLSCEPDVLFKEDFVARFRLEHVRRVPGLNQGITPAEPNVWVPVRLLYSGYTLERLHPWCVAAVVDRNTLYLSHDLLPIHSYLPLLNI